MPVTTLSPRKPAIFLVLDGESARLVRALSSQAALKHCTKNILVKRATSDDIVAAFEGGSMVENVEVQA